MISLDVGELISASSVIIVAFFGGEEGISGDRTYAMPFFGNEFLQQINVYYLTSFWVLVSAALMYLCSRTPVGRMANAVRDNPERAEFLGYSARWVRYYSFVASGFFAGIAGGLFAINYEILTEENLNTASSGVILLVTFLGGVGFFFGPIIGAIDLSIGRSERHAIIGPNGAGKSTLFNLITARFAPTAGMSHSETDYITDLIMKVTTGKTLIIVEHDMGVVFGLAARISVLVYGEIIATGKPADVQTDPKVQDAYLGAALEAEH